MASDSFPDEVERATQSLRSFSAEADRGAKGQARREQEAEQGSALGRALSGAAGTLGGALVGASGGLIPAASAYGATGSADDAADIASAGVVSALTNAKVFGIPLGQLAAGVTGVSKEIAAKEGARGEVFGGLSDLARYNVPISDEFLQKVIDTKVAQHDRIEEFRARVTAKTAYTVDDAGNTAGGAVLEKLADVLEALKRTLDNLPGMGGGAPR